MSQDFTSDLQAEERALLDALRLQNPARVERPAPPDPDVVLGRIGVTYLSPKRPNGYLRLYPQDFIVEEVRPDGVVVPLRNEAPFVDSDDKRTLWADLVKASISGPHAMTDLQRGLGIESGQIGYSGIKDAIAVTSQRVSLRGVTKEAVDGLQHDRLWVRPVQYGNGALQPGDLKGNRFSIVIRGASSDLLEEEWQGLQERGFLNFFGAQRFGNRLISHQLGRCLLRGETDELLRMYFGEPGMFDIPLFRDVRKALNECFRRWDEMLEVARNFPFTLRDEIRVLEALANDPRKTRAALSLIRDQVKLWVYAYSSWLVNRQLSRLMERGASISGEMPLPLSDRGPLPEYQDDMRQDGTERYAEAMRQFPFLQIAHRTIPSRMIPTDCNWKKIPEGWVARFALGKGAYATSCLSHLFRLYDALPVPDWVPKEEVDSFSVLGEGSLGEIRTRFAPVLVRRDIRVEEQAEESGAG